jgi:hypothetical protein
MVAWQKINIIWKTCWHQWCFPALALSKLTPVDLLIDSFDGLDAMLESRWGRPCRPQLGDFQLAIQLVNWFRARATPYLFEESSPSRYKSIERKGI